MIFLEKEIVGDVVCNFQKLVCRGQKSMQFSENKCAICVQFWELKSGSR